MMVENMNRFDCDETESFEEEQPQDIYNLMISDPIEYCNGERGVFESYIENPNGNPSLCHAYEWAKYMENEHKSTGKSIIELAEKSQNNSFGGWSLSWTIWAMSLKILLKCWKYNKELRKWVDIQKKKYPELYK